MYKEHKVLWETGNGAREERWLRHRYRQERQGHWRSDESESGEEVEGNCIWDKSGGGVNKLADDEDTSEKSGQGLAVVGVVSMGLLRKNCPAWLSSPSARKA